MLTGVIERKNFDSKERITTELSTLKACQRGEGLLGKRVSRAGKGTEVGWGDRSENGAGVGSGQERVGRRKMIKTHHMLV